MTSNMPLRNSAPSSSLAHTLVSTFQPDDTILIDSGRLYPSVLVEEVKHLVLGSYSGFQNVVKYIIQAGPEEGSVALEESVGPHDRTSSAQNVTTLRHEAEGMLEQRPHNHSNSGSLLSEADASAFEEARQPTPHEDSSSDNVSIARSKRAWMWITILIVGVLSLVVVPGLLVGIITGQIPWGIALAGAIATIVSFFAGLYYHCSK